MEWMINPNVGRMIRSLRKKYKYSAEELAEMLNRSVSTIYNYELNKQDCPVEILFRILLIFNKRLSISSIIEWETISEEEMKRVLYKKIGRALKSAREKQELEQEDVAKEMRVTRSAIAMYESGCRMPNIQTLTEICVYLEIPIHKLFDIEVEDIRPNSFEYFYSQGTYGIKRGEVKIYNVSYKKEEIIRVFDYLNQYNDISDCHIENIIDDFLYDNN